MNVTALGMICGPQLGALGVPVGHTVEHPAVHVRLRRRLEGAERERPAGGDGQAGELVELGHRVELLARRDRAVGDRLEHAVPRAGDGVRRWR